MRRTRILLVEMPRMLCDIVEDVVAEQPDMEVVGTLEGCASLVAVASETGADVVILGLGNSELPPICEDLVIAPAVS